MKIRITSDSTCDLSAQLLERFDVGIIPLYVVKDGVAYKDSEEITTDDIFAHVAAGGALCTTSAVSQMDYEEFFARQLSGCDGLVHVTISGEMSVCFNNACEAAKRFANVHVVDSRNLSTGQGLVVMAGAELAAQGTLGAAEIAEKMRDVARHVDASFVVDKLDYLRKGGRCSALAALGANLLGIKPCIEVREGTMLVGKKYRGSFEKALRMYVRDRLSGATDIDQTRIMLTHTPVADGVTEAVRSEIMAYQHFEEILDTDAHCTVACHCGPNTLGILYIRK